MEIARDVDFFLDEMILDLREAKTVVCWKYKNLPLPLLPERHPMIDYKFPHFCEFLQYVYFCFKEFTFSPFGYI